MLFNLGFRPDLNKIERLRLVKEIDLRSLAHLGDAVFELHERERELLQQATVKSLHNKVVGRVNSKEQARLLVNLKPLLTEAEQDIVRRARNLKVSGFRRNVEQSVMRQATAFEALIGFLYLTDEARLQELLELTSQETPLDGIRNPEPEANFESET
ncbi:MAG: Mini-ribonuclease 3 [Candidatus Obscuribacter sp.]|nr:Mini-ribonuclease 3 [Candidatus Obscuribacter sp.]MBK9278941.1 Mini-ribonuclease 3 [Candidatus Obscuribacter sp.]MBL8085812.1 ribonuclease III [Candidatus Obscuribacter sp.]